MSEAIRKPDNLSDVQKRFVDFVEKHATTLAEGSIDTAKNKAGALAVAASAQFVPPVSEIKLQAYEWYELRHSDGPREWEPGKYRESVYSVSMVPCMFANEYGRDVHLSTDLTLGTDRGFNINFPSAEGSLIGFDISDEAAAPMVDAIIAAPETQ
ncbi:MAG: hypothetical protein JWO35_446 [Candidatus Saccharibacteria bacterium]|nr:hypothetical protein [Candidatus Saccharibacteria bacterium]